MTASTHPLDAPVVPTCPPFCCFRTTCPTWMQQGITKLFDEGRLERREDCVTFGRLAKLVRQDLGCVPPATAIELEALRARMTRARASDAERVPIQQEGS